MKRFQRFETAWQDLILIVVGVVMLFCSIYLFSFQLRLRFGIPNKTILLLFASGTAMLPVMLSYALLVCGFMFATFGLAELGLVMYWQNRALLKRWHRNRMKQANKGVVWIWAVCLAGICVYAIAYYAMVYPTLELIGIVEGMTSWDADAAFTLNLVRTVLNWHPIIFIIGMLIWGFVNSQRREVVTYPY